MYRVFQKGLSNFEMKYLWNNETYETSGISKIVLEFIILQFTAIILRLDIRGHCNDRAVYFKWYTRKYDSRSQVKSDNNGFNMANFLSNTMMQTKVKVWKKLLKSHRNGCICLINELLKLFQLWMILPLGIIGKNDCHWNIWEIQAPK